MSNPTGQPARGSGPDVWSQPPAEILEDGAKELPQQRRRRWPLVAGVAAMLIVSGAGIALGLALSGGGTQPEDVLPADALAYADVDFDPGAGQKVNLLRLLNRFPDVRSQLGDRSDIKSYLVAQLLRGNGILAPDDVTPWLGDRAGVAVLWDENAGAPVLVLALQVTDTQQAEQALSSYDEADFAFDRGYVILTPPFGPLSAPGMSASEVVDHTATASLADDVQFQAAMEPLGSGLASLYVDGDALAGILKGEMGALGLPESGGFGLGTDVVSGQYGAVLRAEPAALEVVGRSTHATAGVSPVPTDLMATLPDNTTAAFALGGGGDSVADQWEQLTKQLRNLPQIPGIAGGQLSSFQMRTELTSAENQFDRAIAKLEGQYNIRLPDDLITLFGDDMVVAVAGQGLLSAAPGVGIRSVTDPAAAAELADRLQPVLNKATAGYGATVRAVEDGLVVASSQQYADQLTRGEGGLLENPRVVAALPDIGQASTMLWVDLGAIGDFATLLDPSAAATLGPLEGLGVSAGVDDDGMFFRARLTFADD